MNETGLRLADVCELNIKEGEKIKISPIGDVIGLDGRAYKIDANALIASIQKASLDIPLDKNHSFGEAMGWFPLASLEAREDGIYGSLELNTEGKELIENRKYRYLSPVFYLGENRVVTGLDSVGLVNRPNLLNKALNQKTQGAEEMEKELLEANNKLSAANAQLTEANKRAEALTAENGTLKTQIAELNKKFREQRIENAIKVGELLANKRDFALSLENDAQLEAFLAVSKNDAEHLKKQLEIDKNAKETDEVTKTINEQLGIKEDK
jgi:phage I-like protein